MILPQRSVLSGLLTLVLILSALNVTANENGGEQKAPVHLNIQKSEDLYRLYEYEKSVCFQFTNLISNDEEWMKRFLSLEDGKPEGVINLLRSSRHRDTATFKYILDHPELFSIGVDFHTQHLANAGAIYCATGWTRLRELESLGPSQFSWKAHRFFLDACFDDIAWPWQEGPGGNSFDNCAAQLNKAKHFYRGTPIERDLHEYIEHQARLMTKTEAELADTEGYGGKTPRQHAEELVRWVKELRK